MVIPLQHPPGATPLDPDEAAGLKPGHITTQGELDAWEQLNIVQGRHWAERTLDRSDLLDEGYVLKLHQRMFDDTWKWAGRFRNTDKTIGVDSRYIGIRLRDLLADARYWIANGTYSPDEIAIRFHHRLVLIHPFPNGNGRHSRLIADLLARKLAQPIFTWGAGADLVANGGVRQRYIMALRAADAGDITPLLAFSRS